MEHETVCGCPQTHAHTLELARQEMPAEEVLFDLADVFKTFGDSTRIRILWALSEGEMCVCDLSALLNMTQSAISHQLRILRSARLVKFRKAGRIAFYSLDDSHIGDIFSLAFEHVTERREG